MNCPTTSGSLKIDGAPCNTQAWCCLNLDELWNDPDQRGDNLVVPGADGAVPGPRFMQVQVIDLVFVVDGAYATGGPALCTPAQWEPQLYDNVRLMRRLMSSATAATADSTRTAAYTDPHGTTWSGPAHFRGPDKQSRNKHVGLYVITMEVVGGSLITT